MKALLAVILAGTVMLLGCEQRSDDQGGSATDTQTQSGRDQSTPAPSQPDNTGINERDRAPAALTPGDQGQSEADVEITRRIRRAITEKEGFSINARNVKIITAQGKVTLRGPVNSMEESQQLQQLAQAVPGVSSVDNQIEVKTQANKEK